MDKQDKKSLNKKSYTNRTDIEKITSNWRKTLRLFERGEWSTVVIRSVTSIELSANFVIRKELIENHNLKKEFVDIQLKKANGVKGKFDKLLLPFFEDTPFYKELKGLEKKVSKINEVRNGIVHSGQFKIKKTAEHIMKECQEIIHILVRKYEPSFTLKDSPTWS